MGTHSAAPRKLADEDLRKLDEEFTELADVVFRGAEGRLEFHDTKIDDRADRMFDIALQLGDRDMLNICFDVFNVFVMNKRPPPWTVMEHIRAGFKRFDDCRDLNEAFGLKTGKRGAPVFYLKRLEERGLHLSYKVLLRGNSKTQALRKLEEITGRSDLSKKVKGMK